MRPSTRSQRGMTLIEVVVALLIFSFGLLGLVGLQGRAHSYALGAENSTRAALLANEIVTATVLAANTNNAGSVDGNAVLSLPSDALQSSWNTEAAQLLPSGKVSFGTLSSDKKRLPITIQWTPPTTASATSNAYTTTAVLP